tara:strand:+ start:1339 stop:1629 length:291 start_codon:yes stop_codon:yes gene_type:complete
MGLFILAAKMVFMVVDKGWLHAFELSGKFVREEEIDVRVHCVAGLYRIVALALEALPLGGSAGFPVPPPPHANKVRTKMLIKYLGFIIFDHARKRL